LNRRKVRREGNFENLVGSVFGLKTENEIVFGWQASFRDFYLFLVEFTTATVSIQAEGAGKNSLTNSAAFQNRQTSNKLEPLFKNQVKTWLLLI
jgi:hypothetical protein